MPRDNALNCGRRAYRWDHAMAIREDDYSYARSRIFANRGLSGQRGYEFANHFADARSARRKKTKDKLAEEFRAHVERWKDETGHLSSMRRAIAHPSYLRIIGLATKSTDHELERLLLHELEAEPDHWFAALTAITGEDPVKPDDDFDGSVAAWLEWGREKGIL